MRHSRSPDASCGIIWEAGDLGLRPCLHSEIQESFHVSSEFEKVDGTTRCLQCDDAWIPVSFKKNSLVAEAGVFAVQALFLNMTCPVEDSKPMYATLAFKASELTCAALGDPVCSCMALKFVDLSSAMEPSLWKFRTTLVRLEVVGV